MPRDRLTPRPDASDIGAAPRDLIRATLRGWRPEDGLERAALDLLLACGPVAQADDTDHPVYLGFPWSAYIDSLEHPDALETPLLRSAWRALCAEEPCGDGVVTVCTHPDLPDHVDKLVAAGVTDVFWTGTMPEESRFAHAPGLRLHPFPALPGSDAPDVTADGPQGLFALCREGGNQPGLWAAVAAGLIPVVSLDGPALPGPAALWQAAAVVHDGSEATLAEMSERLDAIAGNPARIVAMRRALAGIWLLYGSAGLVHDVLVCLMAQASPTGGCQTPVTHGVNGLADRLVDSRDPQGCLAPLITRYAGRDKLTVPEASLVLQQAGSDLLVGCGGDLALVPGPRSAAAWRLIGLARAALGEDSQTVSRFDEILMLLRDRDLLPTRNVGPEKATPHETQLPPAGRTAPLKVFLLGPRGQRTPLAYAPLRRHLTGRISFVDRIEEADLVVTGWNRDLEDNRDHLATLWRAGTRPRLVVLSEEPLWDSLWSGDFSSRDRILDCGDGLQLPYLSLNHVNSDIFRFHRLPCFILSDDRFVARYAMLIAGFAARSPQALLDHWQAVPWQAAFVAERRERAEYAACYPVEGVFGLSLYRSRVAALVPGDRVLRIGQGWPGTTIRRQSLPDWHLDKLARLHGQVRVCGAYENTLQSSYITEKPFDAFAVGAIPVTVADAGHRLFDLIAPEAMLNTRFCAPDVAAARIAAFVPDLVLAQAWREAAQGLLALLRNPSVILAERQRLADACFQELAHTCMSGNTACVA